MEAPTNVDLDLKADGNKPASALTGWGHAGLLSAVRGVFGAGVSRA
jgi:hypothetical protein